MNYGEIKLALKALINRKDITDALAGQFVNQVISDLERILRLGFMEKLLPVTMDGITNAIRIPRDYLELMNFFTDDNELEQCDISRFLKTEDCGTPRLFIKVGDRWMIKPKPQADSTVYLNYFSQTDALVADTDNNPWTLACTNAVLYGAAELAADFFEDERAARFQAKNQQYRDELAEQAIDEVFSGPMAIQPAICGDY
ncbi:hypothetical protein EUV02_03890 [Polymorphobacter arshaanensis]|uniref:Uncharacterized protein n=1 Tax=Glacieibacterium arshaanense TaxID=2511025 RepID=A0A4Y9ERT1_9SPHN|nr:hypothetical protein [Polymorphobacter arshaanensis]TFU06162.1 hypothetical protein EUV02_03890 [Polymorphobacter arshaanensis]